MLQTAGATVAAVLPGKGASAPPPVSGIDGATVVMGVISSLFLPFPPPPPPTPSLSGLSCLSSLSTREEEIAVMELELEISPEPRKFVDDTAAEATLQDVRNVMRRSERLGNMVAA